MDGKSTDFDLGESIIGLSIRGHINQHVTILVLLIFLMLFDTRLAERILTPLETLLFTNT